MMAESSLRKPKPTTEIRVSIVEHVVNL